MNNSLAEVHPELITNGRRRIYHLYLMILPLVQIKKYGGKVLAITNSRQVLRLALMERNARYVPVRE